MKALIALLVVIAVLVAGLLVADRVGETYAAGLISQQLTADLRLSEQPQVEVDGFPFLTQWASGHYQEIDTQLPSITADNVTVSSIDATVKDVHTKPFLSSASQFSSATAGSISLSGVVPFSALPLPSGFTAHASGSTLEVSGTMSVYGFPVPVTAAEKISLSGTTATFTPTDIRAQAAGINVNVNGSAAKQLAVSVDLKGLPFGLQVNSITAAQNGLDVTASGQNVALAGA